MRVLVVVIGSDTTVLWLLLAPAVLVAGFAPAAISFAAGQGAFTVTLVILYNIIQPAGWRVGLVRIEDVALGCAISLVVGVLFWPRGAAAALGNSLARAYTDGAEFLSAAVAFGMGRCDAAVPAQSAPELEASRAAAAARRLDDTFRTYLAERSTKALPLAEVANLVTGVAGLRLAAEAILDLWRRDDGGAGDRAGARQELINAADLVAGWYEQLAAGLTGPGSDPRPAPARQPRRRAAAERARPRPQQRRAHRERDGGADDLDRGPPRRRSPPAEHDRRAGAEGRGATRSGAAGLPGRRLRVPGPRSRSAARASDDRGRGHGPRRCRRLKHCRQRLQSASPGA